MKKAILLVLSVILLLSGCSNSDIQISKTNIANDVTLNTNTITNTSYANPAFHNVNKLPSTFENQKAINNPADMLWSDKTIERYFFVRLKSEDNFYLATNKVYNAFISSLNWTVEYTPAKGELIDYDYILRASDSYNIYFNSKTNIFYFEDSDKYYKLWSQKSNFWNNLRFDKNNAIVDLSDNELILDSQSEKEDIDGDLIPESIYLRTEKNISDFGNDTNLYLMINENKSFIFDNANSGARFEPTINFLNSIHDKSKAIIINSAFKPADDLPIENFYTFTYRDKKVSPVPVIKPEQRVSVRKKCSG